MLYKYLVVIFTLLTISTGTLAENQLHSAYIQKISAQSILPFEPKTPEEKKMVDEISNIIPDCFKKGMSGQYSADNGFEYCVIEEAYVLAQNGNIIAPLIISGMFYNLDNQSEGDEWLDYYVKTNNLPDSLKSDIKSAIVQKLKKSQ